MIQLNNKLFLVLSPGYPDYGWVAYKCGRTDIEVNDIIKGRNIAAEFGYGVLEEKSGSQVKRLKLPTFGKAMLRVTQ